MQYILSIYYKQEKKQGPPEHYGLPLGLEKDSKFQKNKTGELELVKFLPPLLTKGPFTIDNMLMEQ